MQMKIRTKDGHKVVALNRRKAARERCMNCAGWYYNVVAKCEMPDCQLFPYRMGTEKQDAAKRKKAIMKYCTWCCDGSEREKGKCPAYDCPLWAFRKTTLDRTKGHIEGVNEMRKGKSI